MNRNSFVKGISLGLVVGSMVGMAVMPRKKKSTVGRALKTVGSLVEDVVDNMGL